MCKGLMIYFQLSTTFRYKSLKNSNVFSAVCDWKISEIAQFVSNPVLFFSLSDFQWLAGFQTRTSSIKQIANQLVQNIKL